MEGQENTSSTLLEKKKRGKELDSPDIRTYCEAIALGFNFGDRIETMIKWNTVPSTDCTQ